MQLINKRAAWPSFFAVPGLLLALATSTFEGFVFYWLALVFLLLPVLIGLPRSPHRNALTFSVCLFIAWLLIHIFFLSPAFTSKGLYFVSFLVAGFLLSSSCSRDQAGLLFASAVAVFVLLSAWAIIQYTSGSYYLIPVHPRVNTIFFTPNTFAAALNLLLLPLVARYLAAGGRLVVLAATVLLFTALLLTGSRGGWLAFLAGAGAMLVTFFMFRDMAIDRRRLVVLCSILLLVVAGFIASKPMIKQYAGGGSLLESLDIDRIDIRGAMRIDDGGGSAMERLKIYDIAWQGIRQRPWLGHGYNHFQYYQLRDQDPSRMGKLTRFVHNDYLQIWFETGLPGLILLLVLILVLYRTLFRVLSKDIDNRPAALGLLAAFSACFTHALVDFVLYPPLLLLLFGACLGMVSSFWGEPLLSGAASRLARAGIRPALARWMSGILLLAFLSQPAVAHLFYDQAGRDRKRLDIKGALVFYELARRFAPWQPDYYFVEGDIWRYAALVTGEEEPAARADRLFRQGIAANPFRMESLYLRALLHRDLAHLLQEPAGEETVLQWFGTIMEWHPYDIPVKLDYLQALRQYGHADRAAELYAKYRKQYPRSGLLQGFENTYDESENHPGYESDGAEE